MIAERASQLLERDLFPAVRVQIAADRFDQPFGRVGDLALRAPERPYEQHPEQGCAQLVAISAALFALEQYCTRLAAHFGRIFDQQRMDKERLVGREGHFGRIEAGDLVGMDALFPGAGKAQIEVYVV